MCPERCYLVCANQRSGARRHGGVRDRHEYLDLVYRIGSTPNGVFGAKLMWNNVAWAVKRFRGIDDYRPLRRRADVFRAAFPKLAVVHLVRRDIVRQAVSWARAAQDEVWIVSANEHPEPSRQPVYSYELIANLVALLRTGERGWRRLYGELGLRPYEVVYEDLLTTDGHQAAVRGCLRHLGLDDGVAIPPPRTEKQADDLNEAWVQRFTVDAGAA